MIRLKRSRTSAAIPAGFRGAGRLVSERRLLNAKQDHLVRLQTNPKAGHGFDSSWWKAAKPTLKKESAGKCAYCEARADAVAHCDVEHIRPKDEWWWLTCCWDNYCFSCQLCNQKFKGNNFPVQGASMPGPLLAANSTAAAVEALVGTLGPDPLDPNAVQTFVAALGNEGAHLPDPYLDQPEELLAWEVKEASGQVVLVARDQSARAKRAKDACEKYLGLNREELCELRYETYEAIALASDALSVAGGDPQKKQKVLRKLESYILPKHAFAAMSRYFICDVWQLLPRPA
jgi:hypothetical protein